MSYTRESVLEAYRKTGNLRSACIETGCPPYIAFKWLKMQKALNNQDATRYGTHGMQRGAQAEKLFQRLVPEAMSTNSHLESNCPSFDFDINGITVDVKYCGVRSDGRFSFKTAREKAIRPDYYVAFLSNSKDGSLDGCRILVIPDELVLHKNNISISSKDDRGEWLDFEIKAEDLREFFSSDEEAQE